MANGHGGYRKPSKPAPVSGPGALSRRTDGGPTQPVRVAPGGEYGSRQEMEAIQGSADMQGGGGSTPPPPPTIPLGAPSQSPGEPLTSGADLGPGLGPQAAGIASDEEATLEQLAPFVRSLEMAANLPSATPETRSYVRALKARLAGRG